MSILTALFLRDQRNDLLNESPITMTPTDVNIAACVFMQFNTTTGTWTISSEKHYFYLDHCSLDDGSLALIHNGKDFGVVRVISHISFDMDAAAAKVTKPLICGLTINTERCQRAVNEINLRQEELQTKRIQANIQRELSRPRVSRRDFQEEGY